MRYNAEQGDAQERESMVIPAIRRSGERSQTTPERDKLTEYLQDSGLREEATPGTKLWAATQLPYIATGNEVLRWSEAERAIDWAYDNQEPAKSTTAPERDETSTTLEKDKLTASLEREKWRPTPKDFRSSSNGTEDLAVFGPVGVPGPSFPRS